MTGSHGESTGASALYWVNHSSIRLHTFCYRYARRRSLNCVVTSVYPQTAFAASAAILVISYAP